MLRLLSRRKSTSSTAPVALPSGSGAVEERAAIANLAARRHAELPQVGVLRTEALAEPAANACALSTCIAGSRATILEVRCAHADACRLRALGLCEGAAVSVVNSRDCTLLEVRGARLAVSSAIAAGIMVMPIV